MSDDEKTFTIRCNATLRGCKMTVKAKDSAEAMDKAKRHDFEDVVYEGSELADWQITGIPEEE